MRLKSVMPSRRIFVKESSIAVVVQKALTMQNSFNLIFAIATMAKYP